MPCATFQQKGVYKVYNIGVIHYVQYRYKLILYTYRDEWFQNWEISIRFSCFQAALRTLHYFFMSVCMPVCLSARPSVTNFHYVPITVSSWNLQWSRSQRSKPNFAVSTLLLQLEFTYDNEMMHKAWCCLGEVSYCFSRSSVKFQSHAVEKLSILTQIECLRTVTQVWIQQWLQYDA